ncbi:alpha-latrotoxin-Lh1a-like [Neltuma alba]|uniref:alpha-latrotoxin-Lh1a-like n=1 Tax=Neltuma alba TaxID=207710 RepID=UPI0010A4AD2F|nr:alpha-latrotoxin-Lh1a-like [Prosopis alba]
MTSEGAESMDKVEFIMLRNNYGRTALHEAVLSKDYSVVLFLPVAHKRSDLATYWTWNYDFSCKSPMYLAVLIRHEDILCLLLRLIPISSGKTMSNGNSPLHAAISERTKDLLKKIADTQKELLYQRDENNNTPLHYAVYSSYMEGVCIMLETSPMIAFQRNSGGNFPIHLACEKGNVKVVKKLLEIEWPSAGLWSNHRGQNIFHIAAMKGNVQVIEYLLKHPNIHHDAINEIDKRIDVASRELCIRTLLLLSKHKRIDVNLVNNKGLTAKDVVWMQCRIPTTRHEFLANASLHNAGVDLKANMLSMPLTTSINKDWNVKDAAITVILAMYSSTTGSVILLWVPTGDNRFATVAYVHATFFVSLALIAMSVAFLAAIHLIVSNNTIVADVISVIGFIFIFIYLVCSSFAISIAFCGFGSRRAITSCPISGLSPPVKQPCKASSDSPSVRFAKAMSGSASV